MMRVEQRGQVDLLKALAERFGKGCSFMSAYNFGGTGVPGVEGKPAWWVGCAKFTADFTSQELG